MSTVHIVRSGALTTVQDLGRPGYAHLGVPHSGAADPVSLRLANRLVGNPTGAAALETTMTGVDVVLAGPRPVAVTGAAAPVTVDGVAAAPNTPLYGRRISVGTATAGVRCYLAISGGLTVPAELGSRSTDLLSGLGPPPVRDGEHLPLGPVAGAVPPVEVAAVAGFGGRPVLRVLPGPRADWFVRSALDDLTSAPYTVGADSNRIGMRLAGPVLDRSERGELPSEGMVTGALQVPPDGQPVLFLADHPTTGGYPVIGVLSPADLSAAGQLRPGDTVRFRTVSGAGGDRTARWSREWSSR